METVRFNKGNVRHEMHKIENSTGRLKRRSLYLKDHAGSGNMKDFALGRLDAIQKIEGTIVRMRWAIDDMRQNG